ncbi:MAG: hypothetical protein RMK57_16375 [Bryobacterales bacterium]|nr:hypothetical protein [Bryobacteraceae bacterium]MDW8356099.1 hypothetical protein [Bryobacterales bacterium]
MSANGWVESRPDGSATRYCEFRLPPERLRALLEEIFSIHWRHIVFGPVMEGAVFEIRCDKQPELRFLDGYLTVDFGVWHFHLCVGPHLGSRSEELRKNRPIRRAAFFETRGGGCAGGRSWGLRFWNGFDQQMITIFLPNPYLSDEMRLMQQPDWSRLRLYYDLRSRYLNEPMPGDFREAAEAPWAELQARGPQ